MKKVFKTLAAAFLPTILTVTAFNAHVLANTDDISGHWAETQIKEWANIWLYKRISRRNLST